MPFEARHWDGAGRVGELDVPRAEASITTPALLPVVNPHVPTLDPPRLEDLGAQCVITNAYIVHGSDDVRAQAEQAGLHDLLDLDVPIFTDSGSFQLSEYGRIDVDTEEIVAFQREIGSDVATPVDVPTPPDADRETAESDLETTIERLDTMAAIDTGEMLRNAPVQGATYPDLRERSARAASEQDFDVYPVGGVVPLLNQYRYADVVEVTRAAKRGLGLDDPVHLFGAGHPMTFALAAACGCDLFDSAAYALYAREGRYLTPSGTRHLDDMVEFPCECAVCEANDPSPVLRADEDEREALLAEHNLRTSLAELRRVREAIRRGRLFDLLERRARGHPAVLDGYRALLADETLETTDPTRKATFFAISPESADRPEVGRHHDRLGRLDVPESVVLAPEGVHPDSEDVPAAADGVTWRLLPPFGPVPPALAETHPLSVEGPFQYDVASLQRTADGVAALADAHPETDLTVVHDGWPESAIDRLPDGVTVHRAAQTTPPAEVQS